jgi:hypothetical protein
VNPTEYPTMKNFLAQIALDYLLPVLLEKIDELIDDRIAGIDDKIDDKISGVSYDLDKKLEGLKSELRANVSDRLDTFLGSK